MRDHYGLAGGLAQNRLGTVISKEAYFVSKEAYFVSKEAHFVSKEAFIIPLCMGLPGASLPRTG